MRTGGDRAVATELRRINATELRRIKGSLIAEAVIAQAGGPARQPDPSAPMPWHLGRIILHPARSMVDLRPLPLTPAARQEVRGRVLGTLTRAGVAPDVAVQDLDALVGELRREGPAKTPPRPGDAPSWRPPPPLHASPRRTEHTEQGGDQSSP